MTSPLKAPKALIFDMDGVLVDSEPLHKRAKQMAFQEAGIHFAEQTYDSYKRRPTCLETFTRSFVRQKR